MLSRVYLLRISWLLVSLVLMGLDQLSKYWALKYLFFQKPKIIIPGFFNLYLDFNQGAAFSFLSQAGFWAQVFFLTLAVLVSLICLMLLLIINKKSLFFYLGLAFMIGGALGNAIDRIRFSYVTDFIQWHWKNYYWPTFNIADSAICLAVFFIILSDLSALSDRVKSKKEE